MKTVAKKVAKKAVVKPVVKPIAKPVVKLPAKTAAKSIPKVAAKKVAKSVKAPAKPAVKSPAKLAVKPVVKPLGKPAAKSAVKNLPKSTAKVVSKAVAKTTPKVATKVVTKVAPKVIAKPTTKPTIKATIQQKADTKTKSLKSAGAKKVLATKTLKTQAQIAIAKPAKSKAESKPTKAELKLQQPMVIASNIAPKESKSATKSVLKPESKIENKPDTKHETKPENKVDTKVNAKSESVETASTSPVLSKARTSRLASLTVPSMAQSVASTAAKSSYGPAVHAQVLIVPPPYIPKQNTKLANNWKSKSAEEMTDDELLAMPESEYMNIKQMMYFRLKLTHLKKGLLESAGATTEHLRDESAVVPDPTDRATIEEEHALELRTRDRERKLLKKIEQAIIRIDAGDYGYCDETGEAIGVGRLLARPTATLSLEAQQRRELKQKMFGD
jgi:DnaK suppressor protein